MTDESAFLRAILESPEDDSPRLIYADWLDEQGRCDRAEFIRVQVALARFPERYCFNCRPGQHGNGPCRCDPELRTLRRRERKILVGPGDWTPGIVWPASDGNHPANPWTRGFIEGIRVPADFFVRNADAITACQPVRNVDLITVPDWEQTTTMSRRNQRKLRLVGRKKWWPYGIADPGNFDMGWDSGHALSILKAEWPKINFTVPRSTSTPAWRETLARAEPMGGRT